MANVLMVVPALYCGGGLQKISLLISQELIKVGHKVVVVDNHSAPIDKLSYLSIMPVFEIIQSYLPIKENLDVFTGIIKRHNIEIIIYQGFFQRVNKFLNIWHKCDNTPILSVYHSSPDISLPRGKNGIEDKGFKGIVKKILYPLYLKYARYRVAEFLRTPANFSKEIILLAPGYVDLYKKLSGYCGEPKVISNFVTSSKNAITFSKHKQIIYVGRMEESSKKVYRAIKIWEAISDKMPEWQFLLAGEGRCSQVYRNYVNQNNIPRLKFLGHLNDPTQLYSESSILLLTSDKEGFGLVIVEGMLKGCVPVIYNSYLAAEDIIDNEVNGILVTPFDQHEFISRLTDLMTNESKLEEMSKNAIKKARKFLPENIMPLWNDVISSTLENKIS